MLADDSKLRELKATFIQPLLLSSVFLRARTLPLASRGGRQLTAAPGWLQQRVA
jgi:hypothetical protein